MAEFYEGDDKHYLELTDEEIDLIEEVKSGNFGKIIVLMNTLNTFECGFLKEEDIDAALWIGGTGQHGMAAVAKMLAGELNPEGRLPGTYAADLFSSPAMMNYGDNRYVDDGEITTAAYVSYEEGIYVGYRYYETRALEEGEEWYESQVVYPFGYGLGYTGFEWSDYQMTETADGFEVSVTVTNTGQRDGRDVAELYLTKPYTAYDRAHGVEKSAVDLVGFAKTKKLAPGESERTFDISCHSIPMLRRDFEIPPQKEIAKGRLYITARGCYDCRINGSEVTDTWLNPGAMQYDKHIQYCNARRR